MALEVGSRLGHYDVTKIGEGGMGEVYRARNTKLYQALASVYELRSRMLSYFMDHDVILCPVNASPAVPHGTLLTAERWTPKFGQVAKVGSRPQRRSLECPERDGTTRLS